VRTLHGFGYAFGGFVREADAAGAALRLVTERGETPLPRGEALLGRSRDCLVRLDAPGVSRHHARIRVDGEGATLEDLGSRNGTFVAGERLQAPRRLQDGDEILLGSSVVLRVSLLGDEPTTVAEGPA
jgi:pSer/pThr/pTyr-binding forkhead associated (FHA) protein